MCRMWLTPLFLILEAIPEDTQHSSFDEEPTIGLEPMTSFLPRMCSTD